MITLRAMNVDGKLTHSSKQMDSTLFLEEPQQNYVGSVQGRTSYNRWKLEVQNNTFREARRPAKRFSFLDYKF